MFTFDATYDEESSANAERLFYLRSITELRRWRTFGPPVFFAVLFLAALALGAPAWSTFCLSGFFALSVAGPVFFYFARPRAAKQLARKYPIRQVALTPSAVEITAGSQKAVVEWERIKHIWSTGDHLLLVLGNFASVSIPHRSLPHGANEFILASAKNAV